MAMAMVPKGTPRKVIAFYKVVLNVQMHNTVDLGVWISMFKGCMFTNGLVNTFDGPIDASQEEF
jgi:hypothetical protein